MQRLVVLLARVERVAGGVVGEQHLHDRRRRRAADVPVPQERVVVGRVQVLGLAARVDAVVERVVGEELQVDDDPDLLRRPPTRCAISGTACWKSSVAARTRP